jgi:hypothetical protein
MREEENSEAMSAADSLKSSPQSQQAQLISLQCIFSDIISLAEGLSGMIFIRFSKEHLRFLTKFDMNRIFSEYCQHLKSNKTERLQAFMINLKASSSVRFEFYTSGCDSLWGNPTNTAADGMCLGRMYHQLQNQSSCDIPNDRKKGECNKSFESMCHSILKFDAADFSLRDSYFDFGSLHSQIEAEFSQNLKVHHKYAQDMLNFIDDTSQESLPVQLWGGHVTTRSLM